MILRAEGIRRDFFRQRAGSNVFTAVQRLDFELPAGKLTEITGRSGSGKSTLLNLLAGLLRPTEGRVWLGETDIYSPPDGELSKLRNRHIGVVPQGQTGLHALTVAENVFLPTRLWGKGADRAEALRLLETVGIGDLADVKPADLSGGELRRMAIARALIMKPDVLLADEPTGDLDDENTAAVLALLRDTAAAGTAVLLVTHEQEAARYADSVYRMNAGALERLA